MNGFLIVAAVVGVYAFVVYRTRQESLKPHQIFTDQLLADKDKVLNKCNRGDPTSCTEFFERYDAEVMFDGSQHPADTLI